MLLKALCTKICLKFSKIAAKKKYFIFFLTLGAFTFYYPVTIPRKIANNVYIENFLKYAADLQERYTACEPLPAEKLKHLKPKHPVIIVPGITSTTLEIWQSKEKEFRSILWGNFDMFLHLFRNPTDWVEKISLDPITGLDP